MATSLSKRTVAFANFAALIKGLLHARAEVQNEGLLDCLTACLLC